MEGTKSIGNHYEGVAARYLARKGVKILERNVFSRGGEIDLIGMDGDTLVFFEVRYRKQDALVDPVSSISQKKQQSLLRAAAYYLHRNGLWNVLSRIDVVGISPGRRSRYQVHWIKNAIQAS